MQRLAKLPGPKSGPRPALPLSILPSLFRNTLEGTSTQLFQFTLRGLPRACSRLRSQCRSSPMLLGPGPPSSPRRRVQPSVATLDTEPIRTVIEMLATPCTLTAAHPSGTCLPLDSLTEVQRHAAMLTFTPILAPQSTYLSQPHPGCVTTAPRPTRKIAAPRRESRSPVLYDRCRNLATLDRTL